MVHISLPRGLSSLGKNKDNHASGNGNGHHRPEPTRDGGNYNNTYPTSEQKPLILKVYVIKVKLPPAYRVGLLLTRPQARNLAAKDKSGTSDPVSALLYYYLILSD